MNNEWHFGFFSSVFCSKNTWTYCDILNILKCKWTYDNDFDNVSDFLLKIKHVLKQNLDYTSYIIRLSALTVPLHRIGHI